MNLNWTYKLLPLLLLASLLSAITAQQASATVPLTAEFNEAVSRPLAPSLAGTSILLTYEDQWAGLSEENEVAKTPPKLLRFPGGTHAMFYDWETSRYSGKRINALRQASPYTVDKTFELAKRYGSDVSYIVNIYQDSPEKTGRLATYLASKGYTVKYWELGNEPYADIYADKFPNVEAYLDAAKMHATEIKKVFHDAEFGVAANPHENYISLWNFALNQQNDFTNIVSHKYFGPDRAKREDMLARSVQPDTEKAYADMLKNSIPDTPNFVCKFTGKRFWVSEWGLLFIGFDIENTMAHSIWMGRTFIKLARTPQVDMAAYWNLNASPFELIEPVDGSFIRRVPFYVYKMIVDLLNGAERTASVAFSPKGADNGNVVGQLFYDTKGNYSLFVVNSGATEYMVEVPQAATGSLAIEVLSSDDIMATNGYSTAFTSSLRELTIERVKPVHSIIVSKKFTLPGYAVALISFNK